MLKKMHTREQALQKLRQYCAYQERCHFEVGQKLWDLGVRASEHAEVIACLIDDNFLNEERFAIQFAGGKFRMKGWGRKKILYALKAKKVSDYCIKKALAAIDEGEYTRTLGELVESKYRSLKNEQWMVRRKKTVDFALQRGYEAELVHQALQPVISQNREQ